MTRKKQDFAFFRHIRAIRVEGLHLIASYAVLPFLVLDPCA